MTLVHFFMVNFDVVIGPILQSFVNRIFLNLGSLHLLFATINVCPISFKLRLPTNKEYIIEPAVELL